MKNFRSSSQVSRKVRSGQRVCGFTLIEMLVVIAIISLLAMLTVGAISKARSKSLRTAGMIQLRQIGVYFQIYATNHDGYLPYGGYDLKTGWDARLVDSGAATLNELRSILHDPAHKSSRKYPRSYAMTRTNYNKGTGVDNRNADSPVSLYDLGDLSYTLLLSEKFVPDNTVGAYSNCMINYPKQAMDFTPDRKICNYLFADGHVEAVEPEAIIGDGTLTKPEGAWTREPND